MFGHLAKTDQEEALGRRLNSKGARGKRSSRRGFTCIGNTGSHGIRGDPLSLFPHCICTWSPVWIQNIRAHSFIFDSRDSCAVHSFFYTNNNFWPTRITIQSFPKTSP